MGVHIMDRNGDTRHAFDPSHAKAIAAAEERFKKLTGRGFVALGKDGGPGKLIRAFDPNVEETLFIPQLRGG
jgi:hypothetical protein